MRFDLFLSHNADEKRIVSAVAERLLDEFDVRCWLDEWDLRAGSDWHAAIEEALRTCRGCAIFLGGAGWGEAHLHEARTALELAREDPAFLVIPVLLPGASDEAMGVLADFFARTHRCAKPNGSHSTSAAISAAPNFASLPRARRRKNASSTASNAAAGASSPVC